MRQMRFVLTTSMLAVTALRAHAQSAPARVGGYFGLDSNFGSTRSQPAILAGAELSAIFLGTFTVGLAGYGLANEEATVPGTGGATDTLRFGYGGVRVGYVFKPSARFHPVVDLLVGGGETRTEGSAPKREDEVLVAEPAVMMEATLNKYVRGAVGLTYRFVSGNDLVGVSDSDLRGITGRLTIRVGRF